MHTNAHQFALYYPMLSEHQKENTLIVRDTDIVHRITKVLRLSQGESLFLFDQYMYAEFTITTITHQAVTGIVKAQQNNKPWQCSIVFFLPVLKREALAAAVYSLVEAGVQEIQLFNTKKVQREFGGVKEKERLERIIVAAAEQSKNFLFPVLKNPISFGDAISRACQTTAYVGDPLGKPMIDVVKEIRQMSDCALLVGPEGDFTSEEWSLIKQSKMVPLQLTPTILRAEMAAFYLAALFRSIGNKK